MKHLFLLLASFFALGATAHVVESDTICLDDLFVSIEVTQHPIEYYESIDTCTTRYAVVHDWYGRCGIFDLQEQKNITELEYRELYLARTMKLEDGNTVTLFAGKKGIKQGIVSVDPSNDVMSVMMDDEDMFYSLDACRTIDNSIANKARKLLKKTLSMKCNEGATNGQVLVMDTQSGQIKAWVAIEKSLDGKRFEDARLRKNLCSTMPGKIIISSMAMTRAGLRWDDYVNTKCGIDTIGGLVIKDFNWRKGGSGSIPYIEGFKSHSDITMAKALCEATGEKFQERWNLFTNSPREMDALMIAAIFNYVASNGIEIEPSVNSDSVEVYQSTFYDEEEVRMPRQLLKTMLQDGGIGTQWTTKNVDLSGDYTVHRNCQPTLYDENVADLEKFYSEDVFFNYNQITFAGYLPSENPRFTICVTMETTNPACNGNNISSVVNKLAEFLNKK